MTLPRSGIIIPRQSILFMEGMFVKMWDPPTRSPVTPDLLEPTNPVPEVMAMFGYQNTPSIPHTVERDLLHDLKMPTWDGAKELTFFTFRDKDNPATSNGNFPGATIRVPRGAIFHGHSEGHGPPPHTIHWHGIEPTPINDGVGHCSMEIGEYTYQWQPNFIGFYFCHCHRNTVQHFEFGLYQALLIDPPDAYFATLVNPAIPIGAGRDGKRRIAANLAGTPLEALQDNFNPLDTPDPWLTGGSENDPKWTSDPRLQFPTDPHAMTVPFDVEVLWVLDDRDSVWSDLAPDARATYPRYGDIPGANDNFAGNAGGGVGPNDFFAFNDFNADYWFVTGVEVPGYKGETAAIPPGIEIPPALISGVSGVQVSVEAKVGQTILVRCLDAAYDCIEVRFPVDVTVIAWDGRALGVAPYGINHAYTVPAGEHIHLSVARRFDALIKVDTPINGFATVDFVDNEGQVEGDANAQRVLFTARIPFNIAPASAAFTASGAVTDESGAPLAEVTMTLTGAANQTVETDASGNYSFTGLANGSYAVTPSLDGFAFTPPSREVTIGGADATGQNFVGTEAAVGFSISGTVISRIGALWGVTMTLTGAANQTVETDASGNYSFTGLANGRYTVTPSLAGFRFGPPRRKVTIRDADITGHSFKGRI